MDGRIAQDHCLVPFLIRAGMGKPNVSISECSLERT